MGIIVTGFKKTTMSGWEKLPLKTSGTRTLRIMKELSEFLEIVFLLLTQMLKFPTNKKSHQAKQTNSGGEAVESQIRAI